MKFWRSISTLLFSIPLVGLADWRDDCGLLELQDYLQVATLPTATTDGVPLMIVEGGTNYMSSAGLNTFTVATGEFENKTFENVTNTNASTSGHAIWVGRNYFSNSSWVTGTNFVYAYSASDFRFNLLDPNSYNTSNFRGEGDYAITTALPSYPGRICSHAWIDSESTTQTAELFVYREWLNRYDFVASTGNVLMVAGVNNGSGTVVPTIWGQSYNGVTVGRTSGGHSSGDTLSTYEVYGITGGRTKPDIVAPETATSYSTGQVASGATYIYGLADSQDDTTITENTDLQKAILLAGATKEEFPSWLNNSMDNTVVQPLDDTFGAGEMNVFNSHRIIEAGAYSGGNLGYHGWDRIGSLGNSSVSYSFVIPEQVESAEVNVMLCWYREITEQYSNPRNPQPEQIAYIPTDLADLRIELSGGDLTTPIVSDSSVDNLEHIHVAALSPGTYQLTVMNNSGLANLTDAALAWRINMNEPDLIQTVVSDLGIEFGDLIPGMRYEVWESADLSSPFTFVEYFTPTASTHTWAAPSTTGDRHFYRLKFWN